MRQLRLAMAQINTTVGDFAGNTEKILKSIAEARVWEADLIAFPELAVCGYPPEDLLLKPQFIDENRHCLEEIAAGSGGITVVVGFVDAGSDTHNAAAILHDGKLIDVYHKIYLPNYGVFDEERYFRTGNRCPVYTVNGVGIGVNICEDIWYEGGPVTAQTCSGAEVVINISASPYYYRRAAFRERMLATRAADNVTVLAYVNLVGGQDELVFDGNSMIFDEKGELMVRGRQLKEDLVIADLDVESVFRARLHDPRWRKETPASNGKPWSTEKILISESSPYKPKPVLPSRPVETYDRLSEVYDALVLGTQDYIRKNGFEKVVIGLSGGIDSAIVAVIAVDALGKENVTGVSMPSRYSSPGSISDARLLAEHLGIQLITVPIEKAFQAYLDMLSDAFTGTQSNVTEENIQARIRGNILMALSNKFGWIVLTTGNKSEYATGYTTLYGDMAGGFAVIKDVPKTLVNELSLYRNSLAGSDLIPETIINKPPSAELRPDQYDTDSLPSYEILDPVLTAYVEEDKSVEQIVSMGIDEQIVRRAARLVDLSEYKRRQAPPGVKITPRAFGKDRRLPITNRFREW
ncbi:MAG TPA: NAD+ synthase [Dehalococcoidia bacterium]|nr:NAD+ synthase [Dehalococcoidia bacterium]